MEVIYRSFGWVIPIFLIISTIAFFALFWVSKTAWRGTSRVPLLSVSRNWILISWVLGVLLITVIPNGGAVSNPFDEPRPYSLTPFDEWSENGDFYLRGALESFLNFALFAVGGILFALFTQSRKMTLILSLSIFGLFIEVFQYISYWMRVATVTDVIVYVLGSVAGVLLGSVVRGMLAERSRARAQQKHPAALPG